MRFLIEHLPPFALPLRTTEAWFKNPEGTERYLILKQRNWRDAVSLTVIDKRLGIINSASAFTLWGGSQAELRESLGRWFASPRDGMVFLHPKRRRYQTKLSLNPDGNMGVEVRTPWGWHVSSRSSTFADLMKRHVAGEHQAR